jgi:hypothetical protein
MAGGDGLEFASRFVFLAASVYKGSRQRSALTFYGVIMGKIALLPKIEKPGDTSRHLLTERSMPVEKMSEFSILGILVDRLPEAIRLLEKHRFELVKQHHCMHVVTSGLQQVRYLLRLLDNSGIDFGIADLADGIYQG